MDPVPLVPADFTNADVTYSLRRAFQNTLDGHTYDINVAKNIIDNSVDTDLGIKKTAKNVLEINDDFKRTINKIDDAGENIIEQQIKYLTGKEKVKKCFELKEYLKLKHCNLLKILKKEFVKEFGLIEADDLLPDIINQYLDFRYNTYHYSISHVCKLCSMVEKKMEKEKHEIQRSPSIPSKQAITEMVTSVDAFRVLPDYLDFHNYIPGRSYKTVSS